MNQTFSDKLISRLGRIYYSTDFENDKYGLKTCEYNNEKTVGSVGCAKCRYQTARMEDSEISNLKNADGWVECEMERRSHLKLEIENWMDKFIEGK